MILLKPEEKVQNIIGLVPLRLACIESSNMKDS